MRGNTLGLVIGLVMGVGLGYALWGGPSDGIDPSAPVSTLSEPRPNLTASTSPSDTALTPPLQSTMQNISIWPTLPNSAGGVDVSICFQNTSIREIKYVTFEVTPYNAVDDPISSEVGSTSTTTLRYTGPLAGGTFGSGTWDSVWYNGTFAYALIDGLTVEYTDGTTVGYPSLGYKGASTPEASALALNCATL